MEILKVLQKKHIKLFVILLSSYQLLIFSNNLTTLFPQEKIRPIIETNRKTLQMITNWIDDDIYQNSIFLYGLPSHVRNLIDKPIGNDITYSDAMIYLSQFLKKRVSYLELGVSLGKNFFQVINYFKNTTITGFEIEKINPVLETLLGNRKDIEYWDTMANSMKKEKSSLTEFEYLPNQNKILYLSGDIFDKNSWKRLSGTKLNMIFSDACHTPEALLYEYAMIKKYDLLDKDEFILVWDDLGGKMSQRFYEIAEDLSKEYTLDEKNIMIIKLRGWLGINEGYHNIGIIVKLQNHPLQY